MAGETSQVIGTLEPGYINMEAIRISLHLRQILNGERLFDMTIFAAYRGCPFTIGMASGALFIGNPIAKHMMVADRTVFLDTDMQFVVKINSIVKVGQGVYSHGCRWFPSSTESRDSEKK
ncbi:MAG: hypothetical protein KAG92_03840 [Deltaproteobacteria bacterium]|nr:hypothetical protein [Deltaproteobacteria bacterium]